MQTTFAFNNQEDELVQITLKQYSRYFTMNISIKEHEEADAETIEVTFHPDLRKHRKVGIRMPHEPEITHSVKIIIDEAIETEQVPVSQLRSSDYWFGLLVVSVRAYDESLQVIAATLQKVAQQLLKI